MKIALVSPLPPAKTGIADYTVALAEALGQLAEVELICSPRRAPELDRFEVVVYQLGNNREHEFVYRLALERPGVAVLHEPNLHHLIAEMTIGRGDWESYFRAVEYEAGEKGLAHARRVQAGECAPDYAGVPMLRRVLERCTGVVVHSDYAARAVREVGYRGPIARIPHGTWIGLARPAEYKARLGLEPTTPLVGIFGFLKPYKRIPECLRVFRRLRRRHPLAKMVLVGEPHPELPVARIVNEMGLADSVRLLGFRPAEEFTGLLGATDIVLNLRYPTVGETSGTAMRALGLGRCLIVSEVGALAELPEEVCLKVPVDATEEDLLLELLELLLARPDLREAIGRSARRWAESECGWPVVAARYLKFLTDLVRGSLTGEFVWDGKSSCAPCAAGRVEKTLAPVASGETERLGPGAESPGAQGKSDGSQRESMLREEILSWAGGGPSLQYVRDHFGRLVRLIELVPAGRPEDRILEMGSYLQITPLLKHRLGYGEVRACYLGPAGRREKKAVWSVRGERFECEIELFDAERDRFPYPDGYFTTVVCSEVLEHLRADPMHMLVEINRVLRQGGYLVLTTPNIVSLRSLGAALQGYHPALLSVYASPGSDAADRPHCREYTPAEIRLLLTDSGFEVLKLETGSYRGEPQPGLEWVRHLLERYELPLEERGEAIFALGRKADAPRTRYPAWLYGERRS